MKHLDDKELLNISEEVLQSKPELYALYQERKKSRKLTRLLGLVVLMSLATLFTFKCHAQSNIKEYQQSQKQQRVEYFAKFHPVATLAGYEYDIDPMFLLDSGFKLKSSLGNRINNHFGIKCYRKDCPKGHCENYSTEKSHKDFFVKYSNSNDSFYTFARMCRNWMNSNKKTCEYEFFKYYINCYYP